MCKLKIKTDAVLAVYIVIVIIILISMVVMVEILLMDVTAPPMIISKLL